MVPAQWLLHGQRGMSASITHPRTSGLLFSAKMSENNPNLHGGKRSKGIHWAREEWRSPRHCGDVKWRKDYGGNKDGDLKWRKDYGGDKDVFLSHSGKQKNFVRQLYLDLTTHDVSCFFDEDYESLPLGQKFPPLIFEAAETCKVAVVVLSKEFIRSKWPMLELSAFLRAMNSGKNANLKLLPIFFMISPKELSQMTKDSLEWKTLEESNYTRGEWQNAMKEVRSINGLHFGEDDNEVVFREKVVKVICCLLKLSNLEFPIQRETPQSHNQHQSQSEVQVQVVRGFLVVGIKAVFASLQLQI